MSVVRVQPSISRRRFGRFLLGGPIQNPPPVASLPHSLETLAATTALTWLRRAEIAAYSPHNSSFIIIEIPLMRYFPEQPRHAGQTRINTGDLQFLAVFEPYPLLEGCSEGVRKCWKRFEKVRREQLGSPQ